jgi:phosphatidylserine/phosphatidylglycerophosphate/cardiolipin synthase-like enzyme
MPDDFVSLIQELSLKAPFGWLLSASECLRNYPADTAPDLILQRMPPTNNADISFLMDQILRYAKGIMSWEALSWAIETTATASQRWQADQQIELLLTGPLPASGIPARRVDQVLYDLVQSAKFEIVLVTFAASRIMQLAKALIGATKRGVGIKLILEFEESSKGQLSFDALKAFPQELIDAADVYCWPVEKRERNQAGKPGKLHAKVALIDDVVLISSANLTDDAFNRNLEIGVKLAGGNLPKIIREYFEGLCSVGVLAPVAPQSR